VKRADLPPGPAYPSLIHGIGFWTRPLAFMRRCRARYGPRFTIRLPGAPPFVMLTDPDEVKQVFVAPPDVLRPGEGARVLEPIIGSNSVILLDGAAHMSQRKLMLPAFHGEQMGRLADTMAEVTEQEVASWPRGVTVELHPLMQDLTLTIILRAVFGLEPGPRSDALRSHLQAMLRFGDRPISLVPTTPGSVASNAIAKLPAVAEFWRAQQAADELIFGLIAERRRDPGDHADVLAMLLEARHEDGSPMSEQELRDELLTLLVAGHETTASTLGWAFERLNANPAVLARLVDAIDADDDAYVTATIQETLRLRPVLPNVAPRLVAKPIEVGGWSYPVGCSLVPNGYLIHHDPTIYPEPFAFRPERFVDEQPGTYTWIPFGGGRRRCIGASFAMLEMRLVLRELLSSCEVGPTGAGFEPPRRRNITITPGRGSQAVLRDRLPSRSAGATVLAEAT
jgi:cytochrome P450